MTSIGLAPLTEMPAAQTYKGQTGGLYGGGQNTPPAVHLQAALREAAKIQPLDARGQPSIEGKIALISVGMSNTTQHFQTFMAVANRDPEKSARLVLVDGAQGGMDAADWVNPEQRIRQDRPSPWEILDQRLERAGVSPPQVQVAWVLQARRNPAALGAFPRHAEALKADLVAILNQLKQRFPNLRLVYLSSRIYAGYATTALNPEPYAYESAFAVRWVIEDQIQGLAALNHDPERGPVKAPLALWGAYLWADGERPRQPDGLIWRREDFRGDGTHPSPSGTAKVADLLLQSFKTDPTAKTWFVDGRNP
jgi:hypothetical protein